MKELIMDNRKTKNAFITGAIVAKELFWQNLTMTNTI